MKASIQVSSKDIFSFCAAAEQSLLTWQPLKCVLNIYQNQEGQIYPLTSHQFKKDNARTRQQNLPRLLASTALGFRLFTRAGYLRQ